MTPAQSAATLSRFAVRGSGDHTQNKQERVNG